jgi:hypothetical protein
MPTCNEEAAKVQQLLRQTQILHQLPHEKVQGNMAAEMVCQEVQETQKHLVATSQQNQHLQAQLSLLALSGEEDGVDKVKDKEAPWHSRSMAAVIKSREAMVAGEEQQWWHTKEAEGNLLVHGSPANHAPH